MSRPATAPAPTSRWSCRTDRRCVCSAMRRSAAANPSWRSVCRFLVASANRPIPAAGLLRPGEPDCAGFPFGLWTRLLAESWRVPARGLLLGGGCRWLPAAAFGDCRLPLRGARSPLHGGADHHRVRHPPGADDRGPPSARSRRSRLAGESGLSRTARSAGRCRRRAGAGRGRRRRIVAARRTAGRRRGRSSSASRPRINIHWA